MRLSFSIDGFYMEDSTRDDRSCGGRAAGYFCLSSAGLRLSDSIFNEQTHTNPRTQTHTASLSPADGQWVASLILLQKDQIIGHLNWTLKTLISKMPLFVSNTVPAEAVHVLSITNQFHIYPRSTRGLLYCAVILLLLKLHHSGNQLPKGDPWD